MKNLENIKISKAIPDDAWGIQNLTIEASSGMYKLCGWSEEETRRHFPEDKTKEAVERLGKNIANFTDSDILFVAKDEDDKIVGCCLAEKQDKLNRIEAVYVTEDFQGTGLAQKLYSMAFELLNPENPTTLDVFSLNEKAVKFYKKMGFVETGKKFFDKRFKDAKEGMLEITEMIRKG